MAHHCAVTAADDRGSWIALAVLIWSGRSIFCSPASVLNQKFVEQTRALYQGTASGPPRNKATEAMVLHGLAKGEVGLAPVGTKFHDKAGLQGDN